VNCRAMLDILMFSYKKIYVFATAVPQLRCNQA